MTPGRRPRLWLASASPRRRTLLEDAHVAFHVRPPDFDDGSLRPSATAPAHWVTALAYMKARRVSELLAEGDRERDVGYVLGADTVCVHAGRVIGQPGSVDQARSILEAMQQDEHVTMTGLCVIQQRTSARCFLCDAAIVRVGRLSAAQIDAYLASNDWVGKAGGYNLDERIGAGWPITCAGDPTTVMGLPMRRLVPWLEAIGLHPAPEEFLS